MLEKNYNLSSLREFQGNRVLLRLADMARGLFFTIVATGMLILAVGGQANAEDDGFLERTRQTLVRRLDRVYDTWNAEDPLLSVTLSVVDLPEKYVQCLFHRTENQVLCAVASGKYNRRIPDAPPFQLSREAIRRIARLGFDTDTDDDYVLVLGDCHAKDYASVSGLMITALHQAYGPEVHEGISIEITTLPEIGAWWECEEEQEQA